MPLLRKAKRVLLLTLEGNVVPGPSSKDALGYLAANGITALEKRFPVARSDRAK